MRRDRHRGFVVEIGSELGAGEGGNGGNGSVGLVVVDAIVVVIVVVAAYQIVGYWQQRECGQSTLKRHVGGLDLREGLGRQSRRGAAVLLDELPGALGGVASGYSRRLVAVGWHVFVVLEPKADVAVGRQLTVPLFDLLLNLTNKLERFANQVALVVALGSPLIAVGGRGGVGWE